MLTRDVPGAGIESGDVGTVMAVRGDEGGEAAGYNLEVFGFGGETLTIVAVPAEAVGEIRSGKIVRTGRPN